MQDFRTVSMSDAADRLNVSRHTVKKWINAGLIAAKIFPGGRKRIAVQELERFWRSLPNTKPKPEVPETTETAKLPR